MFLGLNHVHSRKVKIVKGYNLSIFFLPLLSEKIDSVKDVEVTAGVVVDVGHDLVHADEGPGAPDPSTAVHQQRTGVSALAGAVGGEQHVGQLDQGDQVAGVTSSGGRPDIISGQ